MHFELDFYAIQLGEVTRWGVRAYSSGIQVSGCPGPGSRWGDLTVPPPSKEGESPSKLVLLVLLGGGGGAHWALELKEVTPKVLYRL